MIFLNPSYLWALLGIVVPIAIHLWSRKGGRTIKIGSIEFLQEKDSRRSSSIKLNELLLLFLRILIICLLVIIIAEPRQTVKTENSPITYLVEPSLLYEKEVMNILDSIEEDNIKLLQPGFPEYEKADFKGPFPTPNYWQLSAEMNTLRTDSIVVFTRAYVAGVKGKRPETGKKINWIVLDPGDNEKKILNAHKNGAEVILTYAVNEYLNLKFEEERTSLNSQAITINSSGDSISVSAEGKLRRLPLIPTDSLKILMVHNDSLDNEVRILKAGYRAIGSYLQIPVEVKVFTVDDIPESNDNLDFLVWLSNKPVIKTAVPKLIYRPDSLANFLVEKTSVADQYYLTHPLTSEDIMAAQLPETLLGLLQNNSHLEEMLPQYDKRQIDLGEFQTVYSEDILEKQFAVSTDLSKYLWILLLLLLLAERGLAYLRKQ
ncbi:hypothetical protein FK178_02350 [Antarcticibacterium arcticum]|uniref:Aerotolerance regulator N-terminal domain-containing protein n=1 Tax=Antarcticibacterium arcticum TaxID=2585771 RepID=A0A5B8YFD5_9FLAO|nr:BatA domain-containing protein [Antarcticibacterium arcticum]QED36625.1 hypothetical protein FK178_02350 [Antarcticibacterium arcticum]